MLRKLWLYPLLGSCVAISLTGCFSASNYSAELHSSQERKMTLGLAQKEIRQGMDQASVAIVLGSPNIVTKDQEGKEAWIYDKIASEVSYSHGSGGIGTGAIWSILGVVGGANKKAGATASTQRTLTVVIKFTPDQKVDTVSYHSSSF